MLYKRLIGQEKRVIEESGRDKTASLVVHLPPYFPSIPTTTGFHCTLSTGSAVDAQDTQWLIFGYFLLDANAWDEIFCLLGRRVQFVRSPCCFALNRLSYPGETSGIDEILPIRPINLSRHPLHPPSHQLCILILQFFFFPFYSVQLHVQRYHLIMHFFNKLFLLLQFFIAVSDWDDKVVLVVVRVVVVVWRVWSWVAREERAAWVVLRSCRKRVISSVFGDEMDVDWSWWKRGAWIHTGINVCFMAGLASVTGIESREITRAPVGHFTLLAKPLTYSALFTFPAFPGSQEAPCLLEIVSSHAILLQLESEFKGGYVRVHRHSRPSDLIPYS
ncbi:hypothetical protein KCU90_g50, partial [Aureobasidium melanogenum]